MVHAGTDDDHAATMRLVCGIGELAGDFDHVMAGHAGDLLLPRRGTRDVVVEARRHIGATESTVDAVLRKQQVIDRCYRPFLTIGQLQLAHRNVAFQHVLELGGCPVIVLDSAEIGEADRFDVCVEIFQAEAQARGVASAVLLLDVPLAFLAPAKTHRPAGNGDAARVLIERQRLPLGIIGFTQTTQITGAQIALRHQATIFAFFQPHQQRHVGVLPAVIGEVLRRLVDVELFQDYVSEGECQRGIGTLLRVQPVIGEFGDFGIIRAHRHRLGAVVACLGEEMCIRRARLRHVGAPRDQVAAVVPIGRFRHIGLLAPDLR